MSTSNTTGNSDRALALLGNGNVSAEQVACALGITPSAISQMLADPMFAAKVAELRFENLQKNTARDGKWDALEDAMLEKLNLLKDLIFKPADVLRALHVINNAKRRGASSTELVPAQQQVVSIVMPVKLVQKFTVNIKNQVIQAGSQELVTMQASTLLDQVKTKGINDGSQRAGKVYEQVSSNPINSATAAVGA